MQYNIKKLIIPFGVPLAILGLAILVFWGLQKTRPDKSVIEQRENIAQVSVETLQTSRVAPQVLVVGQVVSQDIAPLVAPAQLFVDQVMTAVGERVEKDAVLIKLDTRELVLRQAQLQADVAAFEAELENAQLSHEYNQKALKNEQNLVAIARRNVARNEKLANNQSGSQAALDTARQALQQQTLALQQRQQAVAAFAITKKRLTAQLDKAKANLALTNLDIKRSEVRAPFAGYITALNVAQGQRVSLNTVLLEMYREGSLELQAQLPVRYSDTVSQALRNGQSVNARSDNGARYALDRIAASIASNQAGVDVFFKLPNGNIKRLGETLEVNVNLPALDNVMTVPLDALYDNNQIYLIDDGMLQGYRVSRLGQYRDDDGKMRAIIQHDELADGQQVLVSRLPQALTGLKVKPVKADKAE